MSMNSNIDSSHIPIVRRRSSSLNHDQIRLQRFNKSISSGNIYDVQKQIHNNDDYNVAKQDLNLLTAWIDDYKSVKSELVKFNIKNYVDHIPNCKVYFVLSQLKWDTEYELYLIKGYEHQLNEIIENGGGEEDRKYKDALSNLRMLYKRQTLNEEDTPDSRESSELGLEKNIKMIKRRTSEPFGLVMSPKNSQLIQAFPVNNEEVITSVRVDVISGSGKFNLNNEFKGTSELFLTSYRLIVMYKKRIFRLSFLKHIQCCIETLNGSPITSSVIHIYSPIGDDVLIRFKTQAEATTWNSDINELIEQFSNEKPNEETLDLQIYQDTHPNTNSKNDPLKSKMFLYTNKTTCFEMKQMASKEFEVKDLPLSDLCLKVRLSNKLYTVNDNLKMVMLLEHLRVNNDTGDCSEHCFAKELIPSKFKFYLTTTNQAFNEHKSKKEKKDPGLSSTINISNNNNALGSSYSGGLNKIADSFLYNIDTRWPTVQLPQWLLAIMSIIYKEASNTDGAFRVCGNKVMIQEAIRGIREHEEISNFDSLNIHCCTGILKKILNITEHTLLDLRDFNSYQRLQALFTDVPGIKEKQKLPDGFLAKWTELPPKNKLFLEYLIFVTRYISMDIKDQTKMQPSSMGTCIGQCLYGIYIPLTLENGSSSSMWQNMCFELIITLGVPDMVKIERLQEIGLHLDKFYRDNFPERYRAGLQDNDMDTTDSNAMIPHPHSNSGQQTNSPRSEIWNSSSPSSSASTSSYFNTSMNLQNMADIPPTVPPRTKRSNQNSANQLKVMKESRSLENDETDKLKMSNNQLLSSSVNSSPFQRQTNVHLRNRKPDTNNQRTSSPTIGVGPPASCNKNLSPSNKSLSKQNRRHTVTMDNLDQLPADPPSVQPGKIVRPNLMRQQRIFTEQRARQLDYNGQFKRHSQNLADRCPDFPAIRSKFVNRNNNQRVPEPGTSFSPRTSLDISANNSNDDNNNNAEGGNKKPELTRKIIRSKHTVI